MQNKPSGKPLSFVATLSVVLLLSSLSEPGQAQQANNMRELVPEQTIEREMTGAETHHYTVDLKANEFFQVRLEQKGVDVELKLFDANHNVVASMDSPNGRQGPETLSFVAEASGSFALEVRTLNPKAEKGGYAIRREPSRVVTMKDKRRVEVERMFAEGIVRLGVKGQEDSALKQLSQAVAGWEELADGYMVALTAKEVITRGFSNQLLTAQSLLEKGQTQSVKSKADSLAARHTLNDSLNIFRALSVNLADSALEEKASRLGSLSQQTSNYLKALRFFSKQGEGLSLSGIAQTYYNLGGWQENIDYQKLSVVAYEDAIKLLTSSNIVGLNQEQNLFNLRSAKASSLEIIGGILNTRLGKPEEALKYLSPALDQIHALFRETQNPRLKLREALTLYQIGSAHTSASNNRKKGIEFFSKAIEIYRELPDKRAEIARLLISIGAQYSLEFDYETALKNWDDALKIYRELDNKAGQADVLQFRGTMYYLVDNKPKGRESFNEVLSILQSPDYAASLRKTLHFGSGSAFEVFDELDASLIEQTRLDRIGFAYQALEDYEKSIEYYEESLAITRAQKDQIGIRGALRSIGFVYTRLKKWDKAYEYAERALEISRSGNVKEDLARDLTDVGLALLELGKPKEALKYQNEALALYQSGNVEGREAFSPINSPLLNELGRTYDALRNRRLAIFYGKQGVNAIQGERQRLRNFDAEAQKGFLGKKEKHYRRLANWLIDEGRLLEAEQVLQMLKEEEVLSFLRRDVSEAEKLQQRADLSVEEKKALTRYNSIAERITAAGVELDQLQELKRQGVVLSAEQQKRFADLAKETQDANNIFQAFLKQLYEEFAKRTNVKKDLQENLGLKRDLKKWGEGVVFLYTLVGEDRYRVILTTPRSQTDGKTEIRSDGLNKKISDFREALQDPKADPRPLGKDLYDILIKPIEKQLDGSKAKTLLWSLDGNLRLLPVAALWDGQQYFGQKYQNVTITLASRTRLGETNMPNWRVLGLGVTQAKSIREPNGTRDLPFSALPAVKTELVSIVQNEKGSIGIMPGQILLDNDFNETELKRELLKGYQVIHIASHFSLNAGDATQSFLLMGDGQVLTVNELKTNEELSFEDVDLLTLSACQTAVVEKDGSGKEIEGFGYVAQQKGAKAILATLWSVADESTQVLMSEFYRLHKANPLLTKAAALQLAQQEMIEGKLRPQLPSTGTKSPGTKPEGASERATTDETMNAANEPPRFSYDPKKPYAHPYYWAPFILIGNWK